ncbi:uncharacterized protein tef isoform X2 [Battus philenor]|uniref:uncharacterized protein tef isoform X2 n=1 Tax=Battus philenor TaxID=42288 RepID=UPI0035CFB558
MSMHNVSGLSDDEVFFGKISLKEVKKRLKFDRYSVTGNADGSDSDISVKLIETCSEPDLNIKDSLNYSSSDISTDNGACSNWNINSTNNSFLEMENLVSAIEMDKVSNKTEALDNTLDVVEYILNNAPCIKQENKANNIENVNDSVVGNEKKNTIESQLATDVINKTTGKQINVKTESINMEEITLNLPAKIPNEVINSDNLDNILPVSTQISNTTKKIKAENLSPKENLKLCPQKKTQEISKFKTPRTPNSVKKPTVLTSNKTPSKVNTYQYITSPVAAYINRSPHVPLLKNVKPTMPLKGTSFIPKSVKTLDNKSNKENINLPTVAYKCAKTIKVVEKPNEEKFPESQWAKQLMTSLPKPIVTKHIHRENILTKKPAESQSEESFANLTLHQAEVSVCTQKISYNLKK